MIVVKVVARMNVLSVHDDLDQQYASSLARDYLVLTALLAIIESLVAANRRLLIVHDLANSRK